MVYALADLPPSGPAVRPEVLELRRRILIESGDASVDGGRHERGAPLIQQADDSGRCLRTVSDLSVIWCAAVGDRIPEGPRNYAELRRGWCAWQE